MKDELPKLRLCIQCGKLFEPTKQGQYMHPECEPLWLKRANKRKEKRKNNNDSV